MPEIITLLPEHEKEVVEIFQVLNILTVHKERATPPEAILEKIIANLPTTKTVTKKELGRYLYRGEQAVGGFARRNGRHQEITIKTKIDNLMTINWKLWAPLGIATLVAIVVLGSSQFGTQAPYTPIAEETSTPTVSGKQPITVMPASGNVDDAVNAILLAVSDEQALFADTEKDLALVTADSQAINDFGQSYNENEF